jgi:hypothetical protein
MAGRDLVRDGAGRNLESRIVRLPAGLKPGLPTMSPQIEDPGLNKLREEYLKQLLERYEARSKTFRTLLFGFVGFGFVFLLLVLMPFVGLRRQHRALNSQLVDANRRADSVAAALAVYGTATRGFTELRRAIDNGAFELRDAIPRLTRSLELMAEPNIGLAQQVAQQMVQQQITQQQVSQQATQQQTGSGQCEVAPDRSARMNCLVSQQVRAQFDRYAQVLEASVIGPIETLTGKNGGPQATVLRRGLDSIRSGFEARLAATPRFWEQFGGKVDFFGELSRDLDGYWTRFGFQAQSDSLRVAQQRLDTTSAALKTRMTQLEGQEEGLAARLATIESPLGKLPIGLVEGVQIFPLLMAIGFVWICAVLAELAGMRSALQSGYRERDPNQAALTDRHLALIAPLWIADGDSSMRSGAERALLMAPIVLFGLSCVLVVYHWVGLTDAGSLSNQDRWLYGSLYLAAAAGLAIAFRRVLQLIGSEGAAPKPAP